MKHLSIIPALAGAALLAACSASETEGEAPMAEATPNPDEPVSILRPEVEQPEPEEEPVLLEPLTVVIGFPEGGAELDEAALAVLRLALESEQIATSAAITLRGHSDAGGSNTANERASEERAEAVRDWLIEREVDEDRFTIIAFGAQNPLRPNALPNGEPNEKGRAANRRVELEIIPPKGTVQKNPQPEPDATASTETGD